MNGQNNSLPIQDFVQALTRQLDFAQSAMALKARNMKLPMTFAVKDLTLDLRTHVEMVQSEVRLRPAGPGDKDASILHLALTTITKPMIDENAVETLAAPEEKTLKEAMAEQGEHLSDEEQRRLEWVGVNTVSQLRDLDKRRGTEAIQRVSSLPVDRLRAALMRAAQPSIARVTPETTPEREGYAAVNRLRIRGQNLLGQSRRPSVRIGGQEVPVVEAADHEIVVTPLAHQMSGDLVVETDPGVVTVMKLPAQAGGTAAAPANGHSNGGPS
jgi:hypothetical protein